MSDRFTGPFSPIIGQSKTLSATTSSTSQSFTGDGIKSTAIRVHNAGTAGVYIRWGNGSQTATTSDMYIPPNQLEVFGKPANADTVAVITSSGTATVYVTAGNGV